MYLFMWTCFYTASSHCVHRCMTECLWVTACNLCVHTVHMRNDSDILILHAAQ